MSGATLEEADIARRGYPSDLTDAQGAVVTPHLPVSKTRARPRRTDLRAVIDATLHPLRSGCQWRLRPSDLPPWGTVWWCFRRWRLDGAWTRLHRALRHAARVRKGQKSQPAVVSMNSQAVKATEGRAFAASARTSG